jgi:general secretion pathway protein K
MTQLRNSERGLILVIVLWIVSALTAIIVALSLFAQSNISLASVETARLRSELQLSAGLEAAKASILATQPENRVFLDGSSQHFDLGNGVTVEAKIRDASGLLDLNRSSISLLEAIASRPDSDRAGISPLIKEASRRRSAAVMTARPRENESNPAPAIFTSPGELRSLRGATPQSIAALFAVATLYTADGKINPFAAPPEILQAIPNFQSSDAAIFASAKSRKLWKQPQVQNALQKYSDQLAVHESRVFAIELTLQTADGRASQELATTVILDASADVPFQTLSLSW